MLSTRARGLLALCTETLLRARGDYPSGCADPQQLHAEVGGVSPAAETGEWCRLTDQPYQVISTEEVGKSWDILTPFCTNPNFQLPRWEIYPILETDTRQNE